MADNDVAPSKNTAMDELSPGAELKKARSDQEKTLEDISKELHLDRWMVEALERDDYTALGAPVFAKGHLRQYAKLLGIEQSYVQRDNFLPSKRQLRVREAIGK